MYKHFVKRHYVHCFTVTCKQLDCLFFCIASIKQRESAIKEYKIVFSFQNKVQLRGATMQQLHWDINKTHIACSFTRTATFQKRNAVILILLHGDRNRYGETFQFLFNSNFNTVYIYDCQFKSIFNASDCNLIFDNRMPY